MNSVRPNIFPTLVHLFGWPYTLITNPPSKFWHMLPKLYAYTEMRALDTWLLDTWWLLFCHYSPIHTQTKQKHQQVWSVSGLLVLFVILNYIFNSIWTRTKLMDRVTPELESETSTNERCREVRLWITQIVYLLSRKFAALSFKKERKPHPFSLTLIYQLHEQN
jgi:hypothetical protein